MKYMKTTNCQQIVYQLNKIVFFTLVLFLVSGGHALAQKENVMTFSVAAVQLLQGVEKGRVLGFVDLSDSGGESSKLSDAIFQKIEPIIVREGIRNNLMFIERKDLKLIFDEWALDSFGDSGDVGARTLLGADLIITGKVRIDGDFVHCSLKLIQLDNGNILAVAEGYVRAQPHFYDWENIKLKNSSNSRENVTNDSISSDSRLHLWTDKNRYRPGDTIEIFFEVTEPLYVQIIDVTPDGEVTIIYPNVFQQDNLCSPGKVYRVPPENGEFTLEVTPPAGIDRLKAIASPSPIAQELMGGTRGIQFTKKIVDSGLTRAQLSFEIE